MRLIVAAVVFVPLAVVVGIFSVRNSAPLALEVWPFPGILELWTSVWILGFLAVGILVGMAIGWLSSFRWRRRAWRAEREIRRLEKRIEEDEAASPPATSSRPALPGGETPARRAALIEE